MRHASKASIGLVLIKGVVKKECRCDPKFITELRIIISFYTKVSILGHSISQKILVSKGRIFT